ncbi:hypothetical protein [Mesorhizobium sp. Pch-S]|uniref:hypothetical protein n=1 Tax=Mesorhizobium sp. Pch-S TaxID=2082387 RepID=UPI0010119088|nr:hypothetical protein [Mesorhizobium sp. Pch-S]QAZ46136.1 hypothetical protein C1M53_27625 [Mesorhizobium sp. Pch-S]
MKKSSYMTRALQCRDPRFAVILGKLGYEAADMRAAPAGGQVDLLADLRAEYALIVGKKPFHGWDAATLREKIAAAKG